MTLQVITPAGMIYDHHANYITARTTNGEIGILPNMISTIAGLEIDELKVRRPDDETHVDYIAVNGGIIEIKDSLGAFSRIFARSARDTSISRLRSAESATIVTRLSFISIIPPFTAI